MDAERVQAIRKKLGLLVIDPLQDLMPPEDTPSTINDLAVEEAIRLLKEAHLTLICIK